MGAPARQGALISHPRVNADSKLIEQAGPTPPGRDCVRSAQHPAGPRNRLNTLQPLLGLGLLKQSSFAVGDPDDSWRPMGIGS
jgi:hypothetical protein